VEKADSVRIALYDPSGKRVRQLRQKADTTAGYQYMTWRLDEDPVRQPGSPRRPRASESGDVIFPFYRGGGQAVLPGRYKVVVSRGNAKDSTYLEVKPDPRLPYRPEAALALRQLSERLHKSRQQLVEATDRLDEAKESTDKLLALLKDSDDASHRALEKQTKAMQESLKAQRALIVPAPMEKQGYGRPYRLTPLTKLNEAAQYLRAKPEVTASELRLVEHTEELTAEAIGKINTFFATAWADFRKTVEATPIKWMKE
jgi:hypothetical protein